MQRHYLSCPDCHARLRRTGKKQRIRKDILSGKFYVREYECPSCGKFWQHNEIRNLFTHGPLETEKEE
jgi:uncharacterized protein with PIN domain